MDRRLALTLVRVAATTYTARKIMTARFIISLELFDVEYKSVLRAKLA